MQVVQVKIFGFSLSVYVFSLKCTQGESFQLITEKIFTRACLIWNFRLPFGMLCLFQLDNSFHKVEKLNKTSTLSVFVNVKNWFSNCSLHSYFWSR